MKTVHQYSDAKTGIISGAVGGLSKYLLQINIDASFSEKLAEAAITAVVCGAAGYIGKEILVFIKKKLFK
mgnify:CR=1 FL=1